MIQRAERRGRTRYSEPEGVLYSEFQANGIASLLLIPINWCATASGAEKRVKDQDSRYQALPLLCESFEGGRMSESAIQLLPCPFCNADPEWEKGQGYETYITCKTPFCAAEDCYVADEKQWNRRAGVAALTARLEAAEKVMAIVSAENKQLCARLFSSTEEAERYLGAEYRANDAERDARRYRMVHNGEVPDFAMLPIENDDEHINAVDGDKLDAIIDAAIKADHDKP